MASSVNDIAAITADTQRELTGIEVHGFLRPMHGEVMRARVVIDNSSNFTIDSPLVDNPLSTGGQRVFVLGMLYAMDIIHTLNVLSQVGAATPKSIAGKYKLSAYNGTDQLITFPVATDQGGKLVLNVDTASGANPFEGVVYYMIADKVNLPTTRH